MLYIHFLFPSIPVSHCIRILAVLRPVSLSHITDGPCHHKTFFRRALVRDPSLFLESQTLRPEKACQLACAFFCFEEILLAQSVEPHKSLCLSPLNDTCTLPITSVTTISYTCTMPMKKSGSLASIANTLRSINVFRDEPVLDEQGRTEAEIQAERKQSIESRGTQEEAIKVLQDDLVKALDAYRKASEEKVYAHFKQSNETPESVAALFEKAEKLKKVHSSFR